MQTSQAQNMTQALPGMLYGDTKQHDFVSDRVAEAAILCGLFVCNGTNADQAKLPASSANVTSGLLGVAVYNASKPTANGASAIQYEAEEPLDIVHKGYVYGFAEEAMALGDPVFIRITSSGGNTILGKVRNDADTATAVQATGVRVAQACTAAGPVLLEIVAPFST